MAKFITGKTYATRSACDHECVFSFTILKRTAKSVTVKIGLGTVRRGLRVATDGNETFRPFGTYSMCPVISAECEAA